MVRKRTILGSAIALGITAVVVSRRRSSTAELDDEFTYEPTYDSEEIA